VQQIYLCTHIYISMHTCVDLEGVCVCAHSRYVCSRYISIHTHIYRYICSRSIPLHMHIYTYMYRYEGVFLCVFVCARARVRVYMCHTEAKQFTEWPKGVRCLIFMVHFPQKSPIISGCFALKDL